MLGAPFKPYFGLSGIMALDVPLSVCQAEPNRNRADAPGSPTCPACRRGVPGPKKTGRSPTIAFAESHEGRSRTRARSLQLKRSRRFENPLPGLNRLRKNTLNEGHGFSRAIQSRSIGGL